MLKNISPINKKQFLILLNDAHRNSGRTYQDVSDFCGLNPSYIRRILHGERRPQRDKLLALCLFGWSIDPYDTEDILKAGGYKTILNWSKMGWNWQQEST
jgi:hypothetical protein